MQVNTLLKYLFNCMWILYSFYRSIDRQILISFKMSLHKEVIHWGLPLRKRGISVHISQRYERGGTKTPVWSCGQSPASHFCTTQSTEDLLLRNGKGLLIGGRMWIPADGREAQPSLSVRFTKPCVLPIQLWTLQCLTTCWSVFTCPL